jgi:hypothetical protein
VVLDADPDQVGAADLGKGGGDEQRDRPASHAGIVPGRPGGSTSARSRPASRAPVPRWRDARRRPRCTDLSDRRPQPLTRELAERADVVVTMGCGDGCPVIAGKRYLDWDLPDPKGRPIDTVRPLRQEIGRRIQALVDELDAGYQPGANLSAASADPIEQVTGNADSSQPAPAP